MSNLTHTASIIISFYLSFGAHFLAHAGKPEVVENLTHQSQKLTSYSATSTFLRNKIWGFKDENGDVVISANYDGGVGRFSEGLAAVCTKNYFSDDLSCGYIDTSGNEVIPISSTFKDAYPFHAGYAIVLVSEGVPRGYYSPADSSFGVIDRDGEINEFECEELDVDYDEFEIIEKLEDIKYFNGIGSVPAANRARKENPEAARMKNIIGRNEVNIYSIEADGSCSLVSFCRETEIVARRAVLNFFPTGTN